MHENITRMDYGEAQKPIAMKVSNMSTAINIKIDLATPTVNIYPACKRSHASSEMLKMR